MLVTNRLDKVFAIFVLMIGLVAFAALGAIDTKRSIFPHSVTYVVASNGDVVPTPNTLFDTGDLVTFAFVAILGVALSIRATRDTLIRDSRIEQERHAPDSPNSLTALNEEYGQQTRDVSPGSSFTHMASVAETVRN